MKFTFGIFLAGYTVIGLMAAILGEKPTSSAPVLAPIPITADQAKDLDARNRDLQQAQGRATRIQPTCQAAQLALENAQLRKILTVQGFHANLKVPDGYRWEEEKKAFMPEEKKPDAAKPKQAQDPGKK